MAFSRVRVPLFTLVLAGLLAACAPKKPADVSVVLNGFERIPDPALLKRQFDPAEALKKPTYPSHDFDVSTSGYATLTPLTKEMARAAKDKALYKFITGKSAGKVRFTVPGDYKTKGENFPKTWESGLTLSIDSHTPLTATDWQRFQFLAVPVYNPGPLPQTLYARFNDSASSKTITAAAVPLGDSVLEFPLSVLSDARLNPADLKGVTLYLDSAGQDVDPVLIFDDIALHSLSAVDRAKLASEEGGDAEEDEDWDEEDEDAVKKVNVVRPGQTPATAAPAAVSGPAAAE
jgi:hypothetical protein